MYKKDEIICKEFQEASQDVERNTEIETWDTLSGDGQRIEDKIKWCKEFLEEYGHIVIIKEKES